MKCSSILRCCFQYWCRRSCFSRWTEKDWDRRVIFPWLKSAPRVFWHCCCVTGSDPACYKPIRVISTL